MANGTPNTGSIPTVRPDAEPENPEARDINPFKQAFNAFLFGSRDPSYRDIGEFRAKHIQRKSVSDALLMAPPGDPARAQLVATMGAQGAQAAQAMRERYYAKEYKQLVSTQLRPLQEELQAAQEEARERLKIVPMPLSQVVTFEEGQAMAAQATAAKPGEVQPVTTKTGKEGQAKTQLLETPPQPEPNVAMQPGQVGAREFTRETPSFIDPVTGQPVAIASARGIAIDQEVTRDLIRKSNDVQLRIMDVLSSYSGNPYAQDSMKKMIEGVTQQAGQAVTGRVDPRSQVEWVESYRQSQAKTAADTTKANEALLKLEVAESTLKARAADAVQLSQSDPNVRDLMGKRLKKAIDSGKGVDDLTPKQLQELAAIGNMVREQAITQQKILNAQGVQPIPPVMVNRPEKWEQHLDTHDPVFQNVERQEFAQIQSGLIKQLQSVSDPDVSKAERQKILNSIPKRLRPQIEAGRIDDPEVTQWLETQVVGSEAYRDGRARAFMESVSHYEDLQPGIRNTIDQTNARFIDQWVDTMRRKGKVVTPEMVELLQTDRYGTFYRATKGRAAPNWRVAGNRPPRATQDLQRLQARRQAEARRSAIQPGAAEQVSGEWTGSVGVRRTPRASELPVERVERELETPGIAQAREMSQERLADEISKLRRYQLSDVVMRNPELRKRVQDRLEELHAAYIDPVERTAGAIRDFFVDTEEEKKQRRVQRRQETKEILKHLPKVN